MKILVATLLLGTAVALTGCGSDDESEEPLTKEEFITQADEICEKGNKKIEAAADDFADPESPTQKEIETAIKDVVIPALREQHDKIDELEPPEDDADEIDAMLDELDQAIGEVEKDPMKLVSDEDLFAKANRMANDYGLEECGEDS